MIHLYARLHAWVNGLFRPSEETLTREVYDAVLRLRREHRFDADPGLGPLISFITDDVEERLLRSAEAVDKGAIQAFVAGLLDYERMFKLDRIDWSERRSVSELWALRDALKVEKRHLEQFDDVANLIATVAARSAGAVLDATPTAGMRVSSEGITVDSVKLDLLADLPLVIERVMRAAVDEDLVPLDLLPHLRDRIDANLIAASGGNPADPKGFTRALKPPSRSEISDRRALVSTYLGGTPLLGLFDGTLPFTIPTAARFEHHHIVAGSGHGKTQTLQYLVAHDLEMVARGEASVVVLDSQGDLIKNISQLQAFAPGEPLHDRICIIDPTDIEYPVSLNLFDVGIDRLKNYPMLERERLTNSILELYDFVLGALLAAEMTQKQNVIFRYVTRLMLHIPDATIHTLRGLMEPGSEAKFAPHIRKLQGTARHFFDTEFPSREFADTKRQVLRRLWGILENQTFERMFSHPRSKLDLFAEMNAGKVILINTAKDLLKETGTEIFGRFFIALIAQAAQERAVLPERQRLPTFVYIDEAADYFDRNVGIILSQARKFNVGMVLAHQYLGQLDGKLQDAFAANTAIKFAGGVSNKDARALAPMLGCTPEFIEAQPKGAFAASVRGVTTTALPLRFPLGHMEKLPRMSRTDRQALQQRMRARYAVHYSELINPGGHEEAAAEAEAPPEQPTSREPPSAPAPEPPREGEAPQAPRKSGRGKKADAPQDQTDTDASPNW